MQIHIESSAPEQPQYSHVLLEQRVRIIFRRLEYLVRQAHVSLRDINGPRDGIDKQCKLVVKTHGHGTLVVTARAAHSLHAVNSALHRASHSLARLWQRKQRSCRRTAALALPTGA